MPPDAAREIAIVRAIQRWLKTLEPAWVGWKTHGSPFQPLGIADIIGCYHSVFVAIEVKTATGHVTPHQTRFLEQVRRAGGVAGVARNVDEAKLIVGSVYEAMTAAIDTD